MEAIAKKGMRSRTPWKVKMQKPAEPQFVEMPDIWAKKMGHGLLLIPTPKRIAELVNEIHEGDILTLEQLRRILADEANAAHACPMTTGIFLRFVAEATEEQWREGGDTLAPYWRIVQNDYKLNPKFPGGPEAQAKRLELEGWKINRTKAPHLWKVILP
jgi:alkylated DNA nucleotide flippase Atl1